MLLWLAWFATVSGASAFYVRCDQSVAAVRPAIATRSTPVALAMPWREEVVRLNVGGTLFTTKLETLRAAPDSKLASDVEIWRMEDRNTYDDREKGAFFDKDPEAFAWVLGFLRNGCRLVGTPPDHLLEQVRVDARYFGIDELVSALDEKIAQIAQAQAPQTYEYKHHWHPLFWGHKATMLGIEKPVNQKEKIDVSLGALRSFSEAGWRLAHVYPAANGGPGPYVECILERALDA